MLLWGLGGKGRGEEERECVFRFMEREIKG
jgi:hypothetical protein